MRKRGRGHAVRVSAPRESHGGTPHRFDLAQMRGKAMVPAHSDTRCASQLTELQISIPATAAVLGTPKAQFTSRPLRPPRSAMRAGRRLDVVHSEFLELAGQRVAAPAQQLGRFLPPPPLCLERHANQRAFELRHRVVEQRRAAGQQRACRPSWSAGCDQSASLVAGLRPVTTQVGGNVAGLDLATAAQSRSAGGRRSPAGARCRASRSRPARAAASGVSILGSTPSSVAAASR